jgi:arginine N-succinyltransferase
VFIIRQARIEDVSTLVKLAKTVHFINLPADRDIIYDKVVRSRLCFLRAAGADVSEEETDVRASGTAQGLNITTRSTDFFMFVLEDTQTGACLGTSQVVAHMGGPGNPNYSMKLERREFFSQTLQTGTTHMVARLHADESGPTEIGGLILQPAARGARLGRFLSEIRFHLMGLHRKLFADRVIAEMMAPLSPDGNNLLWEFFGRRFIPLSYAEADRHCQYSREFIWSLLPKEDIYLALLPPEARDVVGRVGEETAPARRLLERLGFEYRNFVDPFDGGPHLEAETDSIPIVRSTSQAELAGAVAASACGYSGYVSALNKDGEFRAVQTPFALDGRRISLPRGLIAELGWETGIMLGVSIIDASAKKPAKRSPGRESAPAPRQRKVRQ